MRHRGAPDCHVPENPAESPHILVLNIASCSIPVNLNGNNIPAGVYIFCSVKFSSITAVLAVTHFLAVHPQEKAGINTVECDENLPSIPVGRNFKIPSIAANRIPFLISCEVLRRGTHHLRKIPFECVTEVPVIRSAVTKQLPVRRNRDLLPCRHIKSGFVEINRACLGPRNPVEFPHAVQAPAESRLIPVRCKGFLKTCIRHQSRMSRFLVYSKYLRIFDFRRNRGSAKRIPQGSHLCFSRKDYETKRNDKNKKK